MPRNKVVAATSGAAIGSAVSVVLLWALQSGFARWQVEVPADVLNAFTAIFTTIATFAAGYLTPPGANEGSVLSDDGSVKSAVKESN